MDLELIRDRAEELVKELNLLIEGGSLSEEGAILAKLQSVEQQYVVMDANDALHAVSKLSKLNVQFTLLQNNILKAQEEYSKAMSKLASRGL